MPRPRLNPQRPASGAERVARFTKALKEQGGRRVTVTLSPDEAATLDRLKAAHGLQSDAEGLRLALTNPLSSRPPA